MEFIELKNIIYNLHHLCHNEPNGFTIREKEYKLLDELFSYLNKIKGDTKTLFFTEKCVFPSKEYIKESLDYGCYETEDELKEEFYDLYPNEYKWYEINAKEEEYRGINYRIIFINNNIVINTNNKSFKENNFMIDLSEIIKWLIKKVKETIQLLKKGNYNEFVNNNLDYHLRVGKLRSKDLYEIWPNSKENIFEDISEKQKVDFLKFIKTQPESIFDVKGLEKACARDFFEACSLGYKANNYEVQGLSAKEQYIRFSGVGIFDEITTIDENSCEEYKKYLELDSHDGHPSRVCDGNSVDNVSMWLYNEMYKNKNLNGYVYDLGSQCGMPIETIKFYLALKEKGLPVYLDNADYFIKFINYEDVIGIVPKHIFPRHCQEYFPNEDFKEYMNLPYEDEEEFIKKINWYPVPKIELI